MELETINFLTSSKLQSRELALQYANLRGVDLEEMVGEVGCGNFELERHEIDRRSESVLIVTG